MSTLRERNRLRARAEIAASAMALIEQQGYEATTIEQIAKSAGVSTATFFRHFPNKEDVLFADEDISAAMMVSRVAGRSNPSLDVAALAEPIAEFATELQDERTLRLTHLVMTNRSLEGRSLRMRLRWEREVARRLAAEAGVAEPTSEHALVAAISVSCLTTALRFWDSDSRATGLAALVRQMFQQAILLSNRHI